MGVFRAVGAVGALMALRNLRRLYGWWEGGDALIIRLYMWDVLLIQKVVVSLQRMSNSFVELLI